ncbi:MAG: hypothetical protein ACM3ZE_18725, partial [Myxococcales bacterium]
MRERQEIQAVCERHIAEGAYCRSLDVKSKAACRLVPLARSLAAFWRRCAGRLRRRGPPRFLGVSPRTPRPLRGRLVPPW